MALASYVPAKAPVAAKYVVVPCFNGESGVERLSHPFSMPCSDEEAHLVAVAKRGIRS